MIDHMYYDTFTEEYTLTKNTNAPPERYIEAVRGSSGIYIEHWDGKVDGEPGYRLDIAYLAEEYYTKVHDWRFRDRCKDQNFEAVRLRYFTLPAEKFDEYAERFGLEEIENG